MTKGTRDPRAVWSLVFMSILGFLSCSSPQVAPAPSVHFPDAERDIIVELPGRTRANTEDLRAQYRSGRRTISHVRQRCVTNPPPTPCTETTDVRISAVEGARYINPGDAPKHPQLIAWIENMGDRTTYDGIEPMTSAVYALVVDSVPQVNPAIVRVRFPALRGAEAKEVRTAIVGHVYKCHEYAQPYISDADFQPCTPYRQIAPIGLHSSSAHAVFASAAETVMLSSSDPTWFSCSSGCCSASAYQTYQVRSAPEQPHHISTGHLLALGSSASH